jgi:hypothetical protein
MSCRALSFSRAIRIITHSRALDGRAGGENVPSYIAWVDHDAEARARMQRILALFSEKESRDELGIGSIRNSLADQLFPGTSTIQTRLRYMLFVGWIYRQLECEEVPSSEIAKRARRRETDLVSPLTADPEELGVFGRRAKGAVKRLPSSVYWAGLQSWGILRFDGVQEEYHRSFDAIHRHRRGPRRRDDGDLMTHPLVTWHDGMPDPPDGFPETATLALRREEALWIQERVRERHGETLLGFLAEHPAIAGADWPWDIASEPRLPAAQRELLIHARRFSQSMHGAALVYNHALAVRDDKRAALADEIEHKLADWWLELDHDDLRAWSLPSFWETVATGDHGITERAKAFVRNWFEVVVTGTKDSLFHPTTRDLIRRREQELKGTRSRFVNDTVYSQWTGTAGETRLSYRWPTVKRFMSDLDAGLRGD